MKQPWSRHMAKFLRTFIRRGSLFVLAGLASVVVAVSPMATRPANAQLTEILNLTSFTNSLSSCSIETVGWVICPTMRSIAKLADYGFTYINKDFLRIDYGLSTNNSGVYNAWAIMRNIANALFVVAFMVLVYSQLTGRGSGSYSIKRLLPRLVVAAIAVNLSYYICVILLDISNILGDSLMNILTGISSRIGKAVMPLDASANAYQTGTLSAITSAVLSKPTYAWVLLAPTVAVTVSIATICAAALVLLIMRKAVVMMLVLVSPILFVAYLLPNLERFFMQGSRLFIQLLLLYPILALLLGAGQIVSATIATVGSGDASYHVTGDSYFSMGGGVRSSVTDLTAAGAAVLPLLGAWFLFKNMSSIMSTAGSRLSASIRSRRSQDDKDARVTGKATAGAASVKNAGIGQMQGRHPAYSRTRRRASLGGSSFGGDEDGEAEKRLAGAANQQSRDKRAAQDASENQGPNGLSNEEAQRRLEELENAQISGSAEGLEVDSAVAEALAASNEMTGQKDDEKHVTAKDLFNNLNKAHESKDKERKLSSGQAPAGSGGGQASGDGGPSQPSAPTVSYKAPSMAQSNNIITGSSVPSGGQTTRIIAVPVQVDASSLLGKSSRKPPENVTQPPINGTEEKAKARAQKYLFDAEQDLEDARDEQDIFGHKKADLTEQPHVSTKKDSDDKDKD